MKRRINKRITAKAVILFLILMGLTLSLFLIASTIALAKEDESQNEWLSVDYYSVIRDPVKIDTSYGSYYNASAYVYFGEVYNTVTEQYEPILWRVLDSENDNNSESGATFLLSEQAIFPNKNYTAMPEDVLPYFNYENIYTRSTLVDENIAKQIFSTDELELIRKITKSDYAEYMYGMFGIIVFCDFHYRNMIMAAVTRAESPIVLTETTQYIVDAYNMLGLHMILMGVAAVLVALLPIYSKLLKKINTSVALDYSGDMEAIEISE